MHPLKLKIENFCSFAKAEYVFRDGLVLVEGMNEDKEGSSNGSGKSVFFSDAMVWLLFDMTCRGSKYDDVIRKGATEVSVEGIFQTDSFPVTISRRKQAKKGSVLKINDEIVTEKQLQSLIGLDFITFTSSVIHAQSFRGFADCSESEQKEILTRIMNLEKWDKYRELVQLETKKLQNRIQELDKQSSILDLRLKEIESKIASITPKMLSFKSDMDKELYQLNEKKKFVEDLVD